MRYGFCPVQQQILLPTLTSNHSSGYWLRPPGLALITNWTPSCHTLRWTFAPVLNTCDLKNFPESIWIRSICLQPAVFSHSTPTPPPTSYISFSVEATLSTHPLSQITSSSCLSSQQLSILHTWTIRSFCPRQKEAHCRMEILQSINIQVGQYNFPFLPERKHTDRRGNDSPSVQPKFSLYGNLPIAIRLTG